MVSDKVQCIFENNTFCYLTNTTKKGDWPIIVNLGLIIFFNNGKTANFHVSENWVVEMDMFMSLARIFAIDSPASRNILGLMLSGPVALFISRDFSISFASCSVAVTFESMGLVVFSVTLSGSDAFLQSKEALFRNKLLKAFVLSILVKFVLIPSSIGGNSESEFLPRNTLTVCHHVLCDVWLPWHSLEAIFR